MLAPLAFGDGSAANPSITFSGESTTGIYRPAAGEFGITVLGVQIAYAAADGFYSRQPFKQWNGASYDTLLSSGVANVTLTGIWTFNQQILATAGVKVGALGIVPYHNDPSFVSAAIFISTSDPLPANGNDGDFWYKV
jgi:hypothetical protein